MDNETVDTGVLVECVVSAPFTENTYIFYRPEGAACVVFDPGMQPGRIVSFLDEKSLTPAAILCTHGHPDHIAGNRTLKERWPATPLVIGEGDRVKLTDPGENLSASFGMPMQSPDADATVRGGDVYQAADFRWRVLDTPGHSSGHVTFVLEESDQTHVVCGDVLFSGSVGRTDFPDGDTGTLRESIHSQLFTLPDDAIVYPGHGPQTTIGREKETNPFVGAPAGWRADR